MQTFIILLLAGVLLICAEIFLPGGILGIFGAIALVGAIIKGFSEFGPTGGFLVMLLIVVFLTIVVWLWIKFFPRTRMGKALFLSRDGKNFKSTDESYNELLDKTGIAHTDLRPAGSAVIAGRRLDVVTEGEMINKDRPVRVIKVAGNRVVVRESSESTV